MSISIKHVDLLKEIWEIFMKFLAVMNIKRTHLCLTTCSTCMWCNYLDFYLFFFGGGYLRWIINIFTYISGIFIYFIKVKNFRGIRKSPEYGIEIRRKEDRDNLFSCLLKAVKSSWSHTKRSQKLITAGKVPHRYQYQPNINDPVTKYRSEWGNMCHSSPTKLIFGLENSAPYHKTDISLSSGLTDRFIGDFWWKEGF